MIHSMMSRPLFFFSFLVEDDGFEDGFWVDEIIKLAPEIKTDLLKRADVY